MIDLKYFKICVIKFTLYSSNLRSTIFFFKGNSIFYKRINCPIDFGCMSLPPVFIMKQQITLLSKLKNMLGQCLIKFLVIFITKQNKTSNP